MTALQIEVVIERKLADLPAFVVVPAARIARWKLAATTTVEATLDGVPLGRRSLKRWDESRWFLELKRDSLEQLGKAPGDRARLQLSLASTAMPAELQALIDAEPAARTRWKALTDAQQRMLRENLLDAKTAATRERRARLALLPAAKAPPAKVSGLAATPRPVTLRLIGHTLPGTSCGAYSEVAVGFVNKAGQHPDRMISGGAREATWETQVQVREKGGAPAFHGPAVNGPPHERFLYLSWIGRKDGGAPAMFRRAKLRLDAIPPAVLAKALRTGSLEGRVNLTDAQGMPLCASVKPPVIAWSAG